MKWCLSASQNEEYLQKADELKVFWLEHNKKPELFDILEINPKARIIIFPSFEITLLKEDYDWLKEQYILCKQNMAVIVNDDTQACHCKELGLPFIFGYPARTFMQLNRMRAWGACDAYIDDMLCHSLDIVEEYYDDLQIRVIANSCGWGTMPGIWEGIEGSWFRPEDLWNIDQIDVAEFRTSLDKVPTSNDKFATVGDVRRQEQALYRIYAEQHAWPGRVEDFVFDIEKKGMLNRLFPPDFQIHRNNCKMKCMEKGHCQHCKIYCNMALEDISKTIKKNLNEMENKNA